MKLFYYKLPIFLQYEITYACNSHCIFCYNPYRDSKIDKNIIWRIAKILRKNKIPLIQITGGECSLFKELPQLIKFLSKYSSVSIVTNGIKKVDLPKETSSIFVSLHGLKKTHEKMTNNPNTYEKILTHIKEYVEEGFEVNADTILTSQNYKEIYPIAEVANNLGMKRIILNRYQIGGMGAKNFKNLLPSLKQFKNALTQVIKARKEIGIPIIFGTSVPFCIDERLLEEGLARSCGAGTSYCVIDPQGNLRICNQSTHTYGNILEMPLEKIWNSKKLDDFRSMKWITQTCKTCKFLFECRGGCKTDARTKNVYCVDVFARNLKKPPFIKEIHRKLKIKKYDLRKIENSNFKLSSNIKIIKRKDYELIVTKWNVFTLNETGKLLIKLFRNNTLKGKEIAKKMIKKIKKIDKRDVYEILGLLTDLSVMEIE